MSAAKNDALLTTRFMVLSVLTTIILMAVAVISVDSFGEAAWEGTRYVGMILPGSKDSPGRNRAHYQGLKTACDRLGYDLLLRDNVSEGVGLAKQAAQELINGGAKTIFVIDGVHVADIAELSEEYPHVRFFAVGLFASNKAKIREYSVRDYEPQFLAGMLAGLRTKTGCVGFVAPYSSPNINRGINAFTLGVKRTNPAANVLLTFTGSTNNRIKEEQAVQVLKAARVDVLSYHQDGSAVAYAAERSSIYFISYHELYRDCGRCLGAVTINWEKAYGNMLKSDKAATDNARIWQGMVEDAIDIHLVRGKLTNREFAAIETERAQLMQGKTIFNGEIFDRSGNKRCEANESIGSNYIRNSMNWLIQGVTLIDN